MSIIPTSIPENTTLKYQNQLAATDSSNAVQSNKVSSIKNDTTSTNRHSSKITIEDLESYVGPAFQLDISAEGAYLQSQQSKQQSSKQSQSLTNSNKSSQSISSLFEV